MTLSDVNANSRKGLAVFLPNEQDVSDVDFVGVFRVEEPCSRAGGVESRYLHLRYYLYRVWALLRCASRWRVGFDFAESVVHSCIKLSDDTRMNLGLGSVFILFCLIACEARKASLGL